MKQCFAIIFSIKGTITGLMNRLELSTPGIQSPSWPDPFQPYLRPLSCSLFLKHSDFTLLHILSSIHTSVHAVPSLGMPTFSPYFISKSQGPPGLTLITPCLKTLPWLVYGPCLYTQLRYKTLYFDIIGCTFVLSLDLPH